MLSVALFTENFLDRNTCVRNEVCIEHLKISKFNGTDKQVDSRDNNNMAPRVGIL